MYIDDICWFLLQLEFYLTSVSKQIDMFKSSVATLDHEWIVIFHRNQLILFLCYAFIKN